MIGRCLACLAIPLLGVMDLILDGRDGSLIVDFKTPKLDFHRYDQRDEVHFRRLCAAIRAYLDDLDRGQFIFRPGMGCAMCDFRDAHGLQWRG